ncbi:MAG TPA: amidohydrolase family protein [Candidatus Kapabacteria bacterium]|nr:amidohydrolase family protein [Candidatus Kapabacteria bacterium]
MNSSASVTTSLNYRAPRAVNVEGVCIASVSDAPRFALSVNTHAVELPERALVLPGFVDTHCHLMGLGLMASRVQLRGARSATECAQRMADRARTRPPGEWVMGFGWNQEEWGSGAMPDRAVLDAMLPDNPAVLIRIDSHASWCNTAALHAAGITEGAARERRPDGGAIVADEAGRPTGILIDEAMALVERVIPPPTTAQQAGWIAESIAACLRLGITEVHDMNVEPERLQAMAGVADRGDMHLRCQVFLTGRNDAWKAVPRPAVLGPNVHAVGVKYFADGALGSRGALLLAPYSDAPDTSGLPLTTADELAAAAAEPLERGYAVATHAIGDAAVRAVLDGYERLRAGHAGALLRMEHAQTVHPDDLARFVWLNVVPAVQAVHCTSDAAMAVARLGDERCATAYPWKSLRSRGLPILGGSDFPIESADPMAGLRAFTDRTPQGASGPWHGEQRISREEAVDAYTAWAPLGIPGTHRRGALAPGNDADIVVLDSDPFENPDARVLLTIVGGAIVYDGRRA